MFTKIQEYIEDPQALVCVLIREVEVLHMHSSLHERTLYHQIH
jgi:hypothetical protein